jgi:hypothetical protein
MPVLDANSLHVGQLSIQVKATSRMDHQMVIDAYS